MNLWILLTFTALVECSSQKTGTHSCPDPCSCFFPTSGAEVVCSQSSLTRFPMDGLPPNTTHFSIQSTSLSSVTASDLSAVPGLRHLQLYHVNLTHLPSDLLVDVPDLKTLDLTGNRLKRLPPKIFNHSSLYNLVLKNNQIEEADPEWFPHNSSLTQLDISGNHLSSVSATLLSKLPLLEDLDLSDNTLQDLPPDALKNLHHLKSLNLAGNKLSSLKPAVFSHNLKLAQLFLQENELLELPPTLLRGLQHLQLLLLNQNQLQRLPPGLLDDCTVSFQMTLAGNPWVCDERLDYLWKWITVHSQSVLFLEDVMCAAPGALKHRRLVSLTGRELGL
ncbi:uncharacterized protein V6R79_021028 [Siganus canaliculatus]